MKLFKKKNLEPVPQRYTRTVNITTPDITVVITSEFEYDDMDYLVEKTQKVLDKYKKEYVHNNKMYEEIT